MKSSTIGPGLSDEWSMISIYNQSHIFATRRTESFYDYSCSPLSEIQIIFFFWEGHMNASSHHFGRLKKMLSESNKDALHIFNET